MPLLIHIPHASTKIPQHDLTDFLVSKTELNHELSRLTDWHTNELFGESWPEGITIKASVSRLVVDVERFRDDQHEPCSEFGMGATYTQTTTKKVLRNLTNVRREELLHQYYDPHHRATNHRTEELLSRHGSVMILDAHSYPTDALPTQAGCTATPEIGIGTDPFHTPAEVVEFTDKFFKNHGLSTGVNQPFSGTFVPSKYWRKDSRVRSIMIEIRRDLYLDESTASKNSNFNKIKSILHTYRQSLSQITGSDYSNSV
jgi:N-formylglutamate amidohydrolase